MPFTISFGATFALDAASPALEKDAAAHPLQLEESIELAKTQAIEDTNQWNERAREFYQQSTQLREKARQLIEQAEELEDQEKNSRTNAKTSRELSESLGLESLLSRLRRNDPDTVELDLREGYPEGHGKALGEALLSNTAVTKLSIYHSGILSSLGDSRFSIANSLIESSGSPEDIELQALLQFVSASPSLRCVHVETGDPITFDSNVIRRTSDLLLSSLAASPQIQDLTWDAKCSAESMHFLLQNSPSMERLNVTFGERFSVADQLLIASAFDPSSSSLHGLRSLRHLTLSVVDWNVDLVVAILSHLHEMQTLQCLVLVNFYSSPLCGDDEERYFTALEDYLPRAARLERLELAKFDFHRSNMSLLLDGLMMIDTIGDDTPATTYITSLAFSSCSFNQAASRRLACFLQTPLVNGPSNKVVHQSLLRELSIVSNIDYPMERHLSRALAVSLLPMARTPTTVTSEVATSVSGQQQHSIAEQHPNVLPTPTGQLQSSQTPTIALQLHTVRLGGVYASFFAHLAANVIHGRVPVAWQTLSLIGVSLEAGVVLARCLPHLSLRQLHLANVHDNAIPWIVLGLKTNGSICSVTTDNEDGTTNFNATSVRLINAYCQRNEQLDPLLEPELDEQGFDAGSMDQSDITLANDTAADAAGPLPIHAAQRHARPTLLDVAQQIPYGGSGSVIRGLSRLGTSAGPDYSSGEIAANVESEPDARKPVSSPAAWHSRFWSFWRP